MGRRVLVLGSHGQIGAPLCEHLESVGHAVTPFDLVMGREFDLRDADNPALAGALKHTEYVYFLAFDVGGAPYLDSHGRTARFIDGNTALMNNTFEALRRWGGPFAFASSQMSLLPHTPYGALKARGEKSTQALGGTSVRMWNIYGIERDRVRAHVITDFAHMALERGVITMRTPGTECRDFTHAADCARGLGSVMDLSSAEPICLASGTWTSIREVADIVAESVGAQVQEGRGADPFPESGRFPPQMGDLPGWYPQIPLHEGIAEVVAGVARSWST